MSGEPRGKRAPIDFSQSDIDQLTAGRRPPTVTRRLKAATAPPTRTAGGGDKRAPAAVKRGDLASLRAGRPSPTIRKRLFADSSAQADAAVSGPAVSGEGKAYPRQTPPQKSRRGR
jgi:hypothetical protein